MNKGTKIVFDNWLQQLQTLINKQKHDDVPGAQSGCTQSTYTTTKQQINMNLVVLQR
jgi:hypothetical protein